MGMDATAILFYGYCWTDHEKLFDVEDDWQTTLLKKRGEKNPWDDYPDTTGLKWEQQQAVSTAWKVANQVAITAWVAKSKAVDAEFGVDIGYHGSMDYALPYVYADDSRVRVDYGCCKDLTGKDLTATQLAWDEVLDRFMTELCIEKPHPAPRWWLVAYYG